MEMDLYLPPDTGDKQYFKILSSLAGVKPEGSMPLQAVTNSLSGRFSRGSPVFVISSCEGDGTVPAAVRDLVGRGHEVTVLSPSSIDFERLVSRIPRMSYEVLKLERQNRLTTLAGSGAQVIDWMPDMDLSQAIMQVRGIEMAGEVDPTKRRFLDGRASSNAASQDVAQAMANHYTCRLLQP